MSKVKKMIATSPTLAIYNPELPTTVQSDASSYGLGAVLLQTQKNGDVLPVAYASRTLTRSEKQYAQIEKECLGVVWSCERFGKYLCNGAARIKQYAERGRNGVSVTHS